MMWQMALFHSFIWLSSIPLLIFISAVVSFIFIVPFPQSLYWSFTELRLSNILCRHNLSIHWLCKGCWHLQSLLCFVGGNSERKREAEKFPFDCEWEPRVSKILICAVEKMLACGLFSVHMSSNHHMYMLTKVDLLPNVILYNGFTLRIFKVIW